MPYTKRLTRTGPGLVFFLLDQSKSMEERIAGDGRSKAQNGANGSPEGQGSRTEPPSVAISANGLLANVRNRLAGPR